MTRKSVTIQFGPYEYLRIGSVSRMRLGPIVRERVGHLVAWRVMRSKIRACQD